MQKKLLYFQYFGLTLLLLLPLALLSCDTPECTHKDFTTEEIEATCEEQGYVLWKCSSCDYSYQTDFKPSTGHTLTKNVTEPTCSKEGFTTYACACGYSYQGNFTEPTNHTYTKKVIAPTCKSEGHTEYTCACGHSYQGDFTAPTDHNYELRTVAPTCEADGYSMHVCKTCDESHKSEILSATGHSLAETAHAATCATEGYTEFSCENCELSYRTDIAPPLGHDFFTSYCLHPTLTSHGKVTEICRACDAEFTNYLFYTDVYPGAHVPNATLLSRGVDVSLYQHKQRADGSYLPLNWSALKNAGMEFAILKAGSTPRTSSNGAALGGIDPVFEMNYTDAKAAGFALGAYFYTYATTEEQLLSDVALLLTWLDGKQFEYPIYFDLEDPSLAEMDKDVLTEFCLTFLNTLRSAGYYSALYTNNDWLMNKLDTEVILSSTDLWYARYPEDRKSRNEPLPASASYEWRESYGENLGLWQYTDYGAIDGIDGIKFDFNYSYKDYPAIIKRFCFNGFAPESE